MSDPVGRFRDALARTLNRVARNRYEAALRQKERKEARLVWETLCPANGWTICVRAGWIRDRDRHRCSNCGSFVPSSSHPIVRRAGG